MIGLILAGAEAALKIGSAIANKGAQDKQAAANSKASKDAFINTSRALSLRQEQEGLAAAQQVHAVTQATVYGRGSLAANAASAGVEGNTVDALDADLLRRDYTARDTIDRNLVMTQQQIDMNRKSAQAEMQSRINSVPGGSALATGLQIGGALTSFGYDWLRLHPNADGKTA